MLAKLMKHNNRGENAILNRIVAGTAESTRNPAGRRLSLGIGDDSALFRPRPAHETILTCDWFLEGTHFLRDKHPPDAVGWKCLARAGSDVAAMGGTPCCFLLSLALPDSHTGRWLEEFLGGLRRASRRFDCPLAGGDTTRRPEILINITVVGDVRTSRAIRRSGAGAGDLIYVSGQLGEAELGLRNFRRCKGRASRSNPLLRKHLYPDPRLELGQWLADRRLATAMMDLSDGLSSDLPRLCAASGVGARVESANIPVVRVPDSDRNHGLDPLQLALHGGDDYELLFTVPANKAGMLPRKYKSVALTRIGKITEESGVVLLQESGGERSLIPGGWDPFRTKR
ncbi:MAG TPA: thiamine-phosphate kinase [Candidatus Acidoferrum sp.]